MAKWFGKIFCLALSILVFGCGIPISKKRIVPEGVAETPEKLVAKLERLKPGMTLNEVMQYLNINTKTPGVRFLIMQKEKQELLYGNAEARGTPDELELFSKKLEKSKIIEIRFVETEKSLTIIPWKFAATTTNEGTDFAGYILFYEDRFLKLLKPESFYKKERDTVYITDLLGSLFSTGASQGVRQIK